MKAIEDGGKVKGMSLRDYFAGQAIIGAISNNNFIQTNQLMKDGKFAEFCYSLADSMLKERNK